MKLFSRDFTRKEKILLTVLAAVLLVILYFYLIDIPVRDGISQAQSNTESLQSELMIAEAKLSNLQKMQEELDEIDSSDDISVMESYNNSKKEVDFINEAMLDAVDYSFSFGEVTRNSDQIRRNFSLTYKAADYDTAMKILKEIEECPYRILISNVACSAVDSKSDIRLENVQVSLSATFYETMVGGTEDLALPTDLDTKAAAEAAAAAAAAES